MSIVCCRVEDKEISIASDSITVRGWTQEKDRNNHTKLFKVEDIIIGGVGYCEETSLLQIFCRTTRPSEAKESDLLTFLENFSEWKNKRTKKYDIQNSYIMAVKGHAFYIQSFFIKEILTYDAIGAGADYALSALYLGSDVEKAVETACELSVLCEKPIKKIIMEK